MACVYNTVSCEQQRAASQENMPEFLWLSWHIHADLDECQKGANVVLGDHSSSGIVHLMKRKHAFGQWFLVLEGGRETFWQETIGVNKIAKFTVRQAKDSTCAQAIVQLPH